MLTLVGAKESEEVVVKRVGRRLDRFFTDWEKRLKEEVLEPSTPQFPEAGTATYNTEETVPRAPMPPPTVELRQTKQIPLSPAFAEKLTEASRLAQIQQAQKKALAETESSFGVDSHNDFTQIKAPLVPPSALAPLAISVAGPKSPLPPPAGSPPPRPPVPSKPPPAASTLPPPPMSRPRHGQAPTSDSLEVAEVASAMASSMRGFGEDTARYGAIIPSSHASQFSEMPASQIFAQGPTHSASESTFGGRSGVLSVLLHPAFLVSLLLTVAALLLGYHLLGGEEFLP